MALVLLAVGLANLSLHERARAYADTEAAARTLRSLLQEERNLQWRVLADDGSALHVARQIGDLRRTQYEVRDAMVDSLDPEVALRLREAIDAYHGSIDTELGLLSVGRLDHAMAAEETTTFPAFAETDEVLVQLAARSASEARLSRQRATTTLVAALFGVLFLVAVLFRRAQAAHAYAAAAIAARLEHEREVNASLEQARAMVHHQATHDPLTGLRNRLGLREGITDGVGGFAGQRCVVFVDLDNFKEINDRFGHEEGDRVLLRVGDAIRDAVRSDELAARVGGDEFVVVASVPDREAGESVAARVRERVLATCEREGGGTRLGASVGVSIGPVSQLDGLLTEADHAMYREKQRHRAAVGS